MTYKTPQCDTCGWITDAKRCPQCGAEVKK